MARLLLGGAERDDHGRHHRQSERHLPRRTRGKTLLLEDRALTCIPAGAAVLLRPTRRTPAAAMQNLLPAHVVLAFDATKAKHAIADVDRQVGLDERAHFGAKGEILGRFLQVHGYWPVKFGLRFSMKARLPSLKSSHTFDSSMSRASVMTASCRRLKRQIPELSLDDAHRARRDVVRQIACIRVGRFDELVLRMNLIHQPESQCFGALHLARGEQQIECVAVPDDARERPSHAVLGCKTNAREGRRDHGLFGCETQIAEQRVNQADARGRTIEHRDDRFRERRKVSGAALIVRPPTEVVRPRQLVDELARILRLESRDVAASAECAARTGENDDADVFIGIRRVRGLPHFLGDDIGPRIELLGTIQRERRDAVFDVVENLLVLHVRRPRACE